MAAWFVYIHVGVLLVMIDISPCQVKLAWGAEYLFIFNLWLATKPNLIQLSYWTFFKYAVVLTLHVFLTWEWDRWIFLFPVSLTIDEHVSGPLWECCSTSWLLFQLETLWTLPQYAFIYYWELRVLSSAGRGVLLGDRSPNRRAKWTSVVVLNS